jgi:uncharacterized protein
MKYPRRLDLEELLQHRSVFLFGARQTGKTTYLRETFPTARYFDLLNARTFRELSSRPERLRESLETSDKLIIIDEIQKLPELLDEVHLMIEADKQRRFILTGSSARKLKRGGANLLAGRALTCHFHPLVGPEVEFGQTLKRLQIGSLPSVIDSPMPHEDLYSYGGTYLQEEIQAEGLTRQISSFGRFLEIAALSNGQVLNFTAIGSDAGIKARTVQNYYQILQDTLIGHVLQPFRHSRKRKAVSTAKFYFFDIGVANSLSGRESIAPRTPEFGVSFEHLIFLELRAFLDYTRNREPLTFWQTHSQAEVDFVIGNSVAIEAKGKEQTTSRDYAGLRLFEEELPGVTKILVSLEQEARRTEDGIEVLPVELFLRRLWDGAYS